MPGRPQGRIEAGQGRGHRRLHGDGPGSRPWRIRVAHDGEEEEEHRKEGGQGHEGRVADELHEEAPRADEGLSHIAPPSP